MEGKGTLVSVYQCFPLIIYFHLVGIGYIGDGEGILEVKGQV